MLPALAALLWLNPALAAPVKPCEFNFPIAGSAGFANAQAARQTNNNTYSAAAFYERLVGDQRRAIVAGAEANVTFNAATLPMLCGDFDPFNSVFSGNKNKLPVYGEPLDLYALNAAFAIGHPNVGGFYSASVTQSIVGLRYAMPFALLMNLYPVAFAPLIGVWQRGDGVASYSLDWIGGAYVDTRWGGARVGYTGARGLYGSVDERVIGLFGSLGVSDLQEQFRTSPWSFLKAGIQNFTLGQFGMDRVHDAVGATSLFFRDLPFGELAGEGSGATSDVLSPVALSPGADSAESDGSRLKTLHLRQLGIMQWVDVEVSYAIKPQPQIFEGMVAVHTPGYHPMRLVLQDEDTPGGGFLFKAGITHLPPRYALGVEGGTFFSARAEYRKGVMFAMLLFNDPDQLALYPFATNALSLRIGVSASMQDARW